MTKRIKPIVELNKALEGAEVKVVEVGDRKAYSDSAQSKADIKEFPKFVRVQIVDDPSGINTDGELQIKFRKVDGIDVGKQFTLGKGGYKVVGGQLTFWFNKSTYHGRDWIFTNVSAKGDHFDEWR